MGGRENWDLPGGFLAGNGRAFSAAQELFADPADAVDGGDRGGLPRRENVPQAAQFFVAAGEFFVPLPQVAGSAFNLAGLAHPVPDRIPKEGHTAPYVGPLHGLASGAAPPAG